MIAASRVLPSARTPGRAGLRGGAFPGLRLDGSRLRWTTTGTRLAPARSLRSVGGRRRRNRCLARTGRALPGHLASGRSVARCGGLLPRSLPVFDVLLGRSRGPVGRARSLDGLGALGSLRFLRRRRALTGPLGGGNLRARAGDRFLSGLRALDRRDLPDRGRALGRHRLARCRRRLHRRLVLRLGLRNGHLGRGRRRVGRPRREELERIPILVLGVRDPHTKVQVRARNLAFARDPDGADPLAGGHLVAPLDLDLRQVEVRRVELPVGGPDRHRLARGSERAGVADRAGRGRADRRAHLARDVDSAVVASRVRIPAGSVLRQDLPLDRPRPVPGRLGRGGEGERERRHGRGHHRRADAAAATEASDRRWWSSDVGRARGARAARCGCGVGSHGGESTPPKGMRKGAVARP